MGLKIAYAVFISRPTTRVYGDTRYCTLYIIQLLKEMRTDLRDTGTFGWKLRLQLFALVSSKNHHKKTMEQTLDF